MKKLFPCVFLLLSSFFFVFSKVDADSYTYNLTSSDISFIENNLVTVINTVESYISDNNLSSVGSDYVIAYSWDTLYFGIIRTGYPLTINYASRSNQRPFTLVSSYCTGVISSDFLSISNYSCGMGQFTNIYGSGKYYYSTIPANITPNVLGNDYTFSYDGNSYNVIDSSGNTLPSLTDLYTMWYGSPFPDESTLSKFITVASSKVIYIAEYITSDETMLSIFAIFILFFVIHLFRRLT